MYVHPYSYTEVYIISYLYVKTLLFWPSYHLNKAIKFGGTIGYLIAICI